jgi:hypothetical protein
MVVVYKTEPLTLQNEVIQQAQPPHSSKTTKVGDTPQF